MSATIIFPIFAHTCVGPRRVTLRIPCRSGVPLTLTVVLSMRASIRVRAAGPCVRSPRACRSSSRSLCSAKRVVFSDARFNFLFGVFLDSCPGNSRSFVSYMRGLCQSHVMCYRSDVPESLRRRCGGRKYGKRVFGANRSSFTKTLSKRNKRCTVLRRCTQIDEPICQSSKSP